MGLDPRTLGSYPGLKAGTKPLSSQVPLDGLNVRVFRDLNICSRTYVSIYKKKRFFKRFLSIFFGAKTQESHQIGIFLKMYAEGSPWQQEGVLQRTHFDTGQDEHSNKCAVSMQR